MDVSCLLLSRATPPAKRERLSERAFGAYANCTARLGVTFLLPVYRMRSGVYSMVCPSPAVTWV